MIGLGIDLFRFGVAGVSIPSLWDDITAAVYLGDSFSVAAQDTSPLELAFNNDGTKMYVVGISSDAIYEYILSTAFSVSTASYSGNSFSVAAQDTSPYALAFNNDGTKMYVVGNANRRIYEYILSIAFSISTASYSGNSFSVALQGANPFGLAFNNDGTKMYFVGASSRAIYEYTLSTAFSVSTASYSGNSFSVAAQNSFPSGLAFNNDGTKMYIVGTNGDSVHEYTLSTAFSVSTASYSGNSFTVSAQETNPFGLAFNNDGTKMYVVGNINDSVFEYIYNDLWTPSELGADLTMWLDAEDTASITLNGSNVAQWSDKSVNGRHVSQATASRQPQFVAADPIVAGKPSIKNDSVAGQVGLSASTSFSVGELYFVAYYRDGTTNPFSEFATLISGGGSFGAPRIMGNTGTANWITSAVLADQYYRNGDSVSSLVALPMPATVWRATVFGGSQLLLMSLLFNAGAIDRNWVGGLCEIIATPTLLSDTDRQKLEGYLAWKWGLEADLPAGHPYKNTPPTV